MTGANAADKIITSAGTCTVEVLGVHDNNATANTIATWTLNKYTLVPGKRLNVTDTDVETVDCDSGSYCPGGEYTVETASEATKSCPADFPNSETGAGADTQCYTACTVDMVAKATKVTGNDYYGTGTDTCEPTACIAGWHVKPGLNLTDTIGTTDAGTGYTSNDNNGNKYDSDGITPSDAGIAGDPMAFATAYGDKGMITGHGRCSTQTGTTDDWTWADPTIVNTLTDETGNEGAQYCYCQLDGYKNASGEITPITSAPWVFNSDLGSADYCAPSCALFCAYNLQNDDESSLSFRAAVMNSLPASPAICAANTINIDWNPDNGGEHIKNMCTYEGSIELPTPDPVKPGYTFTGWKLVD